MLNLRDLVEEVGSDSSVERKHAGEELKKHDPHEKIWRPSIS